jgi:hypothetical protein
MNEEYSTENKSGYADIATWIAAAGVAYLPLVALLMNH